MLWSHGYIYIYIYNLKHRIVWIEILEVISARPIQWIRSKEVIC
jgi:hypothetical protein